tara:strand:+ start:3215 stop:3406 length:192 start_codon:yes stop_codon:yes gene_type:complete
MKNPDKKISIQENDDIIHIGSMVEFINDNELDKDEINMLEGLAKGQQFAMASGQGYTIITRLK